MTGTLLTAKLAVPAPPPELVERPRLYARLDDGVRGPVTLLGAPAGWGKTVLLSSWLGAGGGHGYPVAWLSLEPGDGGEDFWRYVHAALTSCGVRLDGVAETAGPQPAALARLPTPVVLVLDDLDRVTDDRTLEGLAFLLRHAAGRLRLVAAARADPALPLHRWRLRGELTELSAGELAFTVPETAELLARHGVDRPTAYAAQLHTRTEGWPAGARLAALAMRQLGNPAWFLPRFSGDDERVAGYLRGEVLAGQPAPVREVLLGTAVLGQVSAGLVEALTGRADGEGILADLERSRAFVSRLAAWPGWHRYHRLFGELLRAELRQHAPERIPQLHRSASDWLAAHGRPLDALRHALAAGDRDRATGLLARCWPEMLGHGHDEPLPVPAAAAPVDALRGDPELALAYAVDRLDRGDLDAADDMLSLACRRGRRHPAGRRDRLGPVATALRVWQAQLRGQLHDAGRLLDLLGEHPPAGAAALALTGLGAGRLAAGELAAAQEAFADGLARVEQAATRPPAAAHPPAVASRPDLSCPRLACASRLALAQAVRGELCAAEGTARGALGTPSCTGTESVHYAYAHVALAIVDFERDRPAAAEASLDRAAHRADPLLSAWAELVRARLLAERGELAAAERTLRDAQPGLGDWPYVRLCYASAEADLRIRRGQPRAALQLRPDAACLARAHLRDGDPAAALAALPDWAAGELPGSLRLDAGLTEALAARRLGDGHRAREALERALRLAEPEGFRRAFNQSGVRELLLDHLDSGTAYSSFVASLLTGTAPPARPVQPGPHTGEPLTDRELAVLRYLPSMLSNVEIAASLCLSVNTVKTHVRHIYRKLHASRRREAVRRARELHLI